MAGMSSGDTPKHYHGEAQQQKFENRRYLDHAGNGGYAQQVGDNDQYGYVQVSLLIVVSTSWGCACPPMPHTLSPGQHIIV